MKKAFLGSRYIEAGILCFSVLNSFCISVNDLN